MPPKQESTVQITDDNPHAARWKAALLVALDFPERHLHQQWDAKNPRGSEHPSRFYLIGDNPESAFLRAAALKGWKDKPESAKAALGLLLDRIADPEERKEWRAAISAVIGAAIREAIINHDDLEEVEQQAPISIVFTTDGKTVAVPENYNENLAKEYNLPWPRPA